MFDVIYPYAALALTFSILWWFFSVFKHPDRPTFFQNLGFWLSSIVYAASVYLSTFSFYYKLLAMLPRDLFIFAIVFFLANNLKSTRGFFLSAIGLGIGGYLLYSNFVENNVRGFFSQESKKETQLKLAASGELLFDIKNPNLLPAISEKLSSFGVSIRRAFPEMNNPEATVLDEYYVLDIPDDHLKQLNTITEVLKATQAIDWVEQNEVISLSPLEEKPVKTSPRNIDYGVNDPKLNEMWNFEQLEVEKLYNLLTKENIQPRKKARIAILDTGIDSEHEDIQKNYRSTKKKYDRDKQSHGTHCAGIAASVTNNGLGIASLSVNNQFVEVTSIKVLSDYGWGTQQDIINGMIEAADRGADVISMSLGGPSSDMGQRAYEEAIAYANSKGSIVVVAAGNENSNAIGFSPANCKGVIAVSAVDPQLNKASFSNYITDLEMGIAAPGVEILSTIPKNNYAAYNGTSMATPHVAGLLGLMKALQPGLNTREAYQVLKQTGKNTKDLRETGKMILPFNAIKKLHQK